MNTMRTLLGTMTMAAVLAGTAGCDEETVTPEQGGYAVLFRTATDPTADYLLTTNDLMTGSISATGNGIEQQGWCYFAKVGDTYLAVDYENTIAIGYRYQEGQLVEAGQFAYDALDCFGPATEGYAIGIGAPWGGGSFDCKINVIDGASVSISNSVTTPVYTPMHNGAQINAWPTGTWVQGDKLYVSFYPLVGDTWETPMTDTAYVSVYSYPGLAYQSTFKDTRTGPIGHYSGQPCILTDESGNRYTISNTSIAAGFTQSTKPSGILKINSGATAFDANYFFDVEALGYKVLGGVYTGNGKVVARVISNTTDASATAWAAFSVAEAPICNIAILDLNAKTLTLVNEVPLHGGQYLTPFLLEDGKVYASVTTSASDAFVYRIDPVTATAEQGARIEGSEIQAFHKF
jgi:hypothetical protein